MSAINLDELVAGRSSHDTGSGTYAIPVEAFDALAEVAQAARDYYAQSVPYSGDADADMAQENLREGLRKFTFSNYA